MAHKTLSFAISSAFELVAKISYCWRNAYNSVVRVLRQEEHRDAMDFEAFLAKIGVEMHVKRKFKAGGRNPGRRSKKEAYDPIQC
jgi:hypothetical protein